MNKTKKVKPKISRQLELEEVLITSYVKMLAAMSPEERLEQMKKMLKDGGR